MNNIVYKWTKRRREGIVTHRLIRLLSWVVFHGVIICLIFLKMVGRSTWNKRLIRKHYFIKNWDFYNNLSSTMIPSTKCFISQIITICPLTTKNIHLTHLPALRDLIKLFIKKHIIPLLSHQSITDHSIITSFHASSLLFSKYASFKDWIVVVALNDGVKDIVSFSSFCLWDGVGCSLYGNKDHSWKDLFKAGMLIISKPRITE